jgi:hypothetical protein
VDKKTGVEGGFVMLIRVTNHCTMGCKHCMIDKSGPGGEHMGLDVFRQALEFVEASQAYVLSISGGEPFDHPEISEILSMAAGLQHRRSTIVTVCSNGLFALDSEKLKIARGCGLVIQVTNDRRFYGRDLSLAKHMFELPGMCFEDKIRLVVPCRRTRENNIEATRVSPMCFNLRSTVRQLGYMAGLNVLQRSGKFCTPSINTDGSIVAGEADTCFKIGDVSMRPEDVGEFIKQVQCNKCGLRNNLASTYLTAIGEIP